MCARSRNIHTSVQITVQEVGGSNHTVYGETIVASITPYVKISDVESDS